MKKIRLANNKGFALVDDDDYENLKQYRWYNSKGYARRGKLIKDTEIVTKGVMMHNQVLDFPNYKVDHKDRNKLNNQKNNLRPCTDAQNSLNIAKNRGKSRFKGVYFAKDIQKWYVQVTINGKSNYVGTRSSEIEAAELYNIRAKELYGEFVVLNNLNYE